MTKLLTSVTVVVGAVVVLMAVASIAHGQGKEPEQKVKDYCRNQWKGEVRAEGCFRPGNKADNRPDEVVPWSRTAQSLEMYETFILGKNPERLRCGPYGCGSKAGNTPEDRKPLTPEERRAAEKAEAERIARQKAEYDAATRRAQERRKALEEERKAAGEKK